MRARLLSILVAALLSAPAFVAARQSSSANPQASTLLAQAAVAAGASTVAATLNYAAAALAQATPYVGAVAAGAAELVGVYAVVKEGIATFQGTCKP
jgi:hypothetical protein